jgi:hypothetical protein
VEVELFVYVVSEMAVNQSKNEILLGIWKLAPITLLSFSCIKWGNISTIAGNQQMIMTDLSYPVLELIVLEYYRISDPLKEKPLRFRSLTQTLACQAIYISTNTAGDQDPDQHRTVQHKSQGEGNMEMMEMMDSTAMPPRSKLKVFAIMVALSVRMAIIEYDLISN